MPTRADEDVIFGSAAEIPARSAMQVQPAAEVVHTTDKARPGSGEKGGGAASAGIELDGCQRRRAAEGKGARGASL